MLVNSVAQQWHRACRQEYRAQANAFFARIGQFVREHYTQVVPQNSAAPYIVVDREPREILQHCTVAIVYPPISGTSCACMWQ